MATLPYTQGQIKKWALRYDDHEPKVLTHLISLNLNIRCNTMKQDIEELIKKHRAERDLTKLLKGNKNNA